MNPENQIVRLLRDNILMKVQRAYGVKITDDFKSLIEKVQSLYSNIDLAQYSSVVAVLGHTEMGFGTIMKEENVCHYSKETLIVNFLDDDGYVEVLGKVDVVSLSNNLLVYQWTQKDQISDKFVLKGEIVEYSQEPCTNGLSYFARKTYKNLETALIYYRDNMAIEAKGKALNDALRHNRLFFKNAPEALLQEALCEYLMSTLRDQATVKREETVDESHPVDLRITFKSTNHMALIEIKWLGRSINESESGFTANYNVKRANEGAEQLINYIDSNTESFPANATAGYLVVYDLRRNKNTNPSKDKLVRKDADFYRYKELELKPDYREIRSDYKGTYRLFIKVSNNAYQD